MRARFADADPGAAFTAQGRTAWIASPSARRAAAVVLALLVTAPLLLLAWATFGTDYTPVGDEAVIVVRVDDVGSAGTPLVGAYSTRGWSHPGPVLFWALAPLWRLSGGAPWSMLLSTVVFNAAATVLVGVLAWRRRGLGYLAVVAVGTALLLHGLRPDTLVWFWNPYVALLPYLAWLLAAAGVASRDWAVLPLAAALGSIVVQLHVAYAPLVAGTLVAVAFTLWRTRRDDTDAPRPSRRVILVSAAVVGVLWAPVLWDLVAGPRATMALLRYFVGGSHETTGLGTGFGIVSRHLWFDGPWSGGTEQMEFGQVVPGESWPLVAIIAALVLVMAWAWIRRRPDIWSVLGIALAQIVVAVPAVGRTEPPLLAYLVVWLLPLAMFLWTSLVWSVGSLAHGEWVARRERTRPEGSDATVPFPLRIAAAVAVVLLVVLPLSRNGADWLDPELPREDWSASTRSALAQLDAHTFADGPVRVEVVGDVFAESNVGVLAGLVRRGLDVVTSDGAGSDKWGASRRWDGTEVSETLTVAVALPLDEANPIERCDADPAVHRIASYDGLGADERAELRALAVDNFLRSGDLTPGEQERFVDLELRGARLAVFAGPDVCGLP